MMRICVSSGNDDRVEVRAVSPTNGLELILAGEAALHRHQETPPWDVLGVASARRNELQLVGRPTNNTKAIEKVVTELLPSGLRQGTLNGDYIKWFHSYSRAEVAFRKTLLGPPGKVDSLARQLGHSLSYRLDHAERITLERRPTSAEVVALGIVEIPDDDATSNANEWQCRAIGSEWFRFREELLELSKALNRMFVKALGEGRVLIVEEISKVARLIHPEHWSHNDFDPADHPNDYFLFTTSLPVAWFDDPASDTVDAKSRRGRPPGGGYQVADAPFVEMIQKILREQAGSTVHGAAIAVVDKFKDEISGNSYDAKIRRLMGRISVLSK